ncbi:MAG TPA: 2Fe-2S iron-sulfur cluster-binding protein [Microbacterium sp.]|uniref:2Fe-2S iron-sulfur cluster-binding protein n=1 Tax=Microbacterium sp. TaxID=51671 RepID=UPI002C8DFB49|nr:2Fe-2S iron-sulfur cluster-binding protein [Microbacterium sp.]HWI30075.1 2Fe-2S iron-sulfur cluster-binding protein [Microbacterium sp.]
MSTITFIHVDGTQETLTADGISVMRAAVQNGIRGIVGECGGQAMCATCHVYVDDPPASLPEMSEDEEEMLECTASPRQGASRLGCQLRATAHFDALTVRLPERQV